MKGIRQDLRFAIRSFAKRPGFSGVAVLTLALGMGAATAIFSVVNGVLLRPLPYPESQNLVVLWNANPQQGRDQYRMSGKDFFTLDDAAESFSGMALVAGATAAFTDEGLPPLRVGGAAVSADLFSILGVRPQMGRDFRPEENQGAHSVVILSQALWQSRFGGDPDILGKNAILDGTSMRIVGVMPRISLPLGGGSLRLPGPETPAFWTPLDYSQSWVSQINAHVMVVMARLRDGRTLEEARGEADALAQALVETGAPHGEGILVRPLRQEVVGDVEQNLLILMGSVILLLLMACGNLANLYLARATDRERELTVRASLGASRRRLIRQILTEILLLGAVGGILGLILAHWSTDALLTLMPASLPRQSQIGVDGRVLLFTLGMALLATILAGLVPSFRISRNRPAGSLAHGSRSKTLGRSGARTNRLIVTFQFALASVLLFGAGLLARSFQSLRSVDPGFQGDSVLTAQLILPATRYPGADRPLTFYRELRQGLESLPGVRSVVLSMDHPMESTWWNGVTLLDQPPPAEGEESMGMFRPVSDGYFRTYGIPVLEGRTFEAEDRLGQDGVMVVNEAFARRYFPEGQALGQRIRFAVNLVPGTPSEFTVVGVVGNVHFNGFRKPSEPAFYASLRQFPYGAVKVQLKTLVPPETLVPALQAQIWALDPELPVTDIQTMAQVISSALARDRFNALLLGVFALAALVLAGGGVFGVLSYLVARRTPELGVRMALGAEPSSILRLVMGDGLAMAGLGLAWGLGIAALVAPIMAAILFGVPPRDPMVLVAVTFTLVLVALASAWFPALRAARTAPLEALSQG